MKKTQSRVLFFSLLLLVIAPLPGQSEDIPTNPLMEVFKGSDWKKCIEKPMCKGKNFPLPPQLPRNFRCRGRYIVRDLVNPETGEVGVDVPFTWEGRDGNVQIIAGGENYPIHFTNLIYCNHLYTYTYKWPGLQPEFLPPLESCAPLFEFSLNDFNAFLATSRYVGEEILVGQPNRRVHHFRVGVVLPIEPPGAFFRLPFVLGDFYVDAMDPTTFWQVLHFGIQNLYDPQLDEWMIIQEFEHCPGKIKLPKVCSKPGLCSKCD